MSNMISFNRFFFDLFCLSQQPITALVVSCSHCDSYNFGLRRDLSATHVVPDNTRNTLLDDLSLHLSEVRTYHACIQYTISVTCQPCALLYYYSTYL